jgi:ATP-binding cassette subfamily B protein
VLVRYLIDDVLAVGDTGPLPWIGLGFVLLALLEGGFTFSSGWLAAQTAEGIAKRLRDYIFDHIQRLSFSYHDRAQTGDLLQRSTSDVDAVQRFFLQQAIEIGRIVLLFLINLIAIYQINARLAGLSVVALPVLWLSSIWFFSRIERSYERYQQQEAKLSATLQENLSGVRVVKAFARQRFEIEKFGIENKEKFRQGIKLLLNHAFYWPVSDVIAGGQMLGGMLAAALYAIDGQISIGDYLAYHGLLIWIIWPMRNLGRVIVQASMAVTSYSRIATIIGEVREPLESELERPHAPKGTIDFRGVGLTYDDGSQVLEDINISIQPGEIVALMGATGSGKTSLINLLTRFYDYSAGTIEIDGQDLRSYSRRYLREHIGLVEQEPFLFSRTIRDNIALGAARDVSDEAVYAAARAAAVHEGIKGFPKGYATLVGERGVTLSGGQKQRIALARTLLKNPSILVLDDATSSVDTETEAEIRAALQHLMVGRTSIIIAHRIQTVMHADQIILMEDGKIRQHGQHDDLSAQPGPYREIFQTQSRIETELAEDLQAAKENIQSP